MAQVISDVVKRKKMITRGLALWQQNAERYRTSPTKYTFLYHFCRGRKKRYFIAKNVLKTYPELPFLRLLHLDEARAYLESLPDGTLEGEILRLEDVLHIGYVYNTMLARVIDMEHWLAHGNEGSSYGTGCAVSSSAKWPYSLSGERSYHYTDYRY